MYVNVFIVQESQSYLFRVAAENEVGVGEFVELSNSITPKSQHGKSRILLDQFRLAPLNPYILTSCQLAIYRLAAVAILHRRWLYIIMVYFIPTGRFWPVCIIVVCNLLLYANALRSSPIHQL